MFAALTFSPQLRQPPVAAGYRTPFFFLPFLLRFKQYKSTHKLFDIKIRSKGIYLVLMHWKRQMRLGFIDHKILNIWGAKF